MQIFARSKEIALWSLYLCIFAFVYQFTYSFTLLCIDTRASADAAAAVAAAAGDDDDDVQHNWVSPVGETPVKVWWNLVKLSIYNKT